MASCCSSIILHNKRSVSGNTGLLISNSSFVGRSENFEQLECSSSVSDLSEFIRTDNIFIFFNLLKIRILSL